MKIALIDNGSLEPAAQMNLRAIAAALSKQVGSDIEGVSWKHSDRVPASALEGEPAWTLGAWVRAQLALGEREFVFVPFFVSAQGAIGSALHADLEKLQCETAAAGGFEFALSSGLTRDAIAGIAIDRVRETIIAQRLRRPSVVVVDHGGPSPVSAALRDALAAEVRMRLGSEIGPLAAASMEGAHGPLLEEQLAVSGFDLRDVVVALLFLSPGRHAGADGDVARICRDAERRSPGLHCHLTALVGTHSRITKPLALALRKTMKTFQAKSFA